MKYNSENINFAKSLRSNMTKEEVKLWNILRAKRFLGYKFKRQVLIGNYIVDFLCTDNNLIIELDGGQHNFDKNVEYDNIRTKYLENNGYKVIRFWNDDIWNNIECVCEQIKISLESLPPLGEGRIS